MASVKEGADLTSYESLAPTYPVWVHLAAGALAGIAEHAATFPIDSVKTRQQSLHECPEVRKGRTPIHGMANIARREGWGRLLRGINIVVVGAIPAHALYFTVYEKTKSLLTGNVRSHSNTFQYVTAGTMASIVHDLVMNPAEVVKQRMQMKNSPYCGSFQCVRCIYRNEGLAAFYRSYTTQLSMNVPFQAVQFATYENIQQVLNPNARYDPKSHLIAGAVAGGLAAVVTTPWDCVKTVLNTQQAPQMAEMNESRAMFLRTPGTHFGVLSAISTIYRARGLLGFTYGMQARVMQAVPSIALSWSVYELFKYLIGDGAGFRT